MSGEPPYAYRPDFIPSETPCLAPIYTERRGRLHVGGTFFRSYLPGPTANNITIEVKWEFFNTDPLINDWEETTDQNIVERVRMIVNDGFGTIQEFTQSQSYTNLSGPTITACDEWDGAIQGIRAQVNAIPDNQKIIQMPERDDSCTISTENYQDVIDASTSSSDAASLNYFPPTNLSGASGPPVDESFLSSIRTGPERTVIINATTEFNDADPIKGNGDQILATAPRRIMQWDGSQWIEYIPFT